MKHMWVWKETEKPDTQNLFYKILGEITNEIQMATLVFYLDVLAPKDTYRLFAGEKTFTFAAATEDEAKRHAIRIMETEVPKSWDENAEKYKTDREDRD